MAQESSATLDDKIDGSNVLRHCWNRYRSSSYIRSGYGTTITTVALKGGTTALIGAYSLLVSDTNGDAILDIAKFGLGKAVVETAMITVKSVTENGGDPKRIFGVLLGSDIALLGVFAGTSFGMEAVANALGVEAPRAMIPATAGFIGASGLPYFSSVYHSMAKSGLGIAEALKRVPGDYTAHVRASVSAVSRKISITSKAACAAVSGVLRADD